MGYYSDMVCGYISRAGGTPRMIAFPKELQTPPTRCPYCHQSSELNSKEMRLLLCKERDRFQAHTDNIIATRKANGERDPYPRRKQVCEEKRSLQTLAHFFFKRNSISPEPVFEPSCSGEPAEDPFYYAVDANKLVVCHCMLRIKNKKIIVEAPEDDENGEDVATIMRYNSKKDFLEDESHTEDESSFGDSENQLDLHNMIHSA